MGYQLWTSPVTGYRRTGTRLSDLRTVLDAGILARTILEPLQCCSMDAPAKEIGRVLKERGFDVAGVRAREKESVAGFVESETLQEGTIREHTKPLNSEHLISDSTTLRDLLTVLRTKERIFVLVGSEVKGIVTRADLNKPPVRVYLFGLVSLMEMHLRYWVHKTYGEESWREELSEARLEAANNRQKERRERNEEIALLDCLQFCDKRDLLLASADLIAKLELGTKKQAGKILKKTEALRDLLAHSQQDLVQGSSWQELIELIEKIEALVQGSDDVIEKEAKSSRKSVDTVWVAS